MRLCPHIYNTRAHINRAIEGVASMRDLINSSSKLGRSL
jgi:hypothetical protein